VTHAEGLIMKKFTRSALLAAGLLLIAAVALADPPMTHVGGPFYVDSNGNLHICSPGGTHCIPLETSEPPLEP
jgi:hypothetical protein